MKIRTQFVSNSSSSSYIILGTPIDKLEDFFSKLEISNGEYINHVIQDDNTKILGEVIFEISSDDGLQDDYISLDELITKRQEISDRWKIPLEDIQLFFGTRMC
jgi:hypothetical protein